MRDKIKDIPNLNFETALKKLEEVVSQIENSSSDLDDSINEYEYGVALKKHLYNKLDQAKIKIDKISEED
ncbi:MAG: exodeoxyribonuclease VII small subunit [Rickettsiales bacterium]|jgi:exodeoxyribonuclease VII small subunit|nr:exodeoxyribonuclease VII small subunit [Rickettsiales bacterium]